LHCFYMLQMPRFQSFSRNRRYQCRIGTGAFVYPEEPARFPVETSLNRLA